ncbi:ABC transporter substrate-binding protein [Cellulomonas endophytica]|uniref:ABC transporter substrate-binding protein n=1 Tax=Cellulomonas endophytica TaxID=2494735 RepID=UPI0010139936|nr:extracellular solute-binding protein [Cellulomonas endophytica]
MSHPLNPPGRRRRRTLAVTATTLALGLALTACSGGGDSSSSSSGGGSDDTGAASGAPVELIYQSWVPNIDQAVDAFNAAHDDIEVTLETITAGPDGGYAKMLSAVQAGNPADVAQVGYDSLPDFMTAGALADITDHVGDAEGDFTAWQWQSGVFADRVHAVPQASGPVGQFYRKDVFDELGLAAPTTWDEYYAAAKAIRASSPDRYIAAFAYNQAPWLIALAQQSGAQWFTVEGDSWKVDLTDPDTQRMAEFWQRLVDEDLVKVEPDLSNEWYADLQAGNVVSWMSGSWAAAILEGNAPDTAGTWAAAEMPQWTAGEHVSASWGGGSANVVLQGSAHVAEAAEFALWLNSDPASVSILNSVGAGWPAVADHSAIESLQDDPDTFAFFGGQNIYDTFAVADANVDTSWKWPPLVSTLYSSLTDNVKASVDGGTPLVDAFAATEEDMVAALDAKGINVTS